MDWDQTRDEAIDVAVRAGFSRSDAEALVSASRPALRLVPAPGEAISVGASKLGGLPDLPPDVDWPIGDYGPMTLFGQVRAADTGALAGVDGWNPQDVLLCFFADLDSETSEVAGGCVLTVPVETCGRREAPAGLPPAGVFIDESPVDLVPGLTPPMSFDNGPELEYDLDADDWAAWERLYEALGCGPPTIVSGHHQLLGQPWLVGSMDPVWMGGVRLATPDEDPDDDDSPFRLLAQFTNDEDANIEIGDGGAIYFVGRAADFAAGSFADVVVFGESH